MIAHPSRDLYAYARLCEHGAAALSSIGHAGDGWKMPPEEWRRHLEAKARLFGRAGDAAAAVADDGPGSPENVSRSAPAEGD